MSHNLTNITVSRDEKNWEVEIKAEIPAEVLIRYRTETLNDIQKTAKLDGFRPGKAPIDRLVQIYGEPAILRQSAEHAIQHELPELLASENLMIIEAPRVSTDTPTEGKPLAITARAALSPKVELADYKKIAEKHLSIEEDTSVSDKEHAEALGHLRRERARIDRIESGSEPQKAAEESRAMEEKDLPALDDEFTQALGYESAEKFSSALRENIGNEKKLRLREKRRTGILDELVKTSKIFYPAVLREYELDDMEARVKDDMERTGRTYEAYLAEIKKTAEEMRASWKDAADNRAKVRLVLAEIARTEHIEPDPAAVDHEIEHAKQQYPGADTNAMRAHIVHAMRNEQTLRFLEGDTEKVGHTAHDH